jgi:hypothetical protein
LKKLGILIFVAGILLSICAFVADKVDHIPFVLRLLAPAYARALAGITKLQSTKSLFPSDEGFAEISRLFFNTAAHENPPEVLASLSIKSFTRQTAMIAFGEDRADEVVPLQVELSNGQKVQWDLRQVEAQLASLKESRVFDYAVVFFILGTVITIIGFVVERFGSHVKV